MILAIVLVFWAVLGMSSWGLAANCGGMTTCACGDTVTLNYTLTANLGPCSGRGLIIGRKVTVDGNGYTITGTRVADRYGLYFLKSQKSVVKNVKVTAFHRGARLQQARNNTLQNVESFDNGRNPMQMGDYGIDLSQGAVRNFISSCSILASQQAREMSMIRTQVFSHRSQRS